MHLFLIGYRGTGKTTVARLVAEQLRRPWLDSDIEIEALTGQSIAEIFAQAGEPAFRDWETHVLRAALDRRPAVIALGGGSIVRPQNRALLKGAGKTVWLTARAETLWQRIMQDRATAGRRPNLTAGGGLAEIERILSERTPHYRESADWVVDTEDKSPAEVARDILAFATPLAPLDPA